MSETLHTVHVRVNDAATGQPTAVRIRFTSPDGKYYAPFGRTPFISAKYVRDSQGGSVLLGDKKEYAYIDGTCEIQLPAGPFVVEVTKGPEYEPLRREVTLGPGKIALRLAIKRTINLRNTGWYSGDIRAFAPHPHAARLEGAAEDLAVVNLLAYEVLSPRSEFRAYPNLLAFSGQRPVLDTPGHMVVVNTHNYHPHLGALSLLNCHRIVYPLRFGAPAGADSWTLAEWCDQCHRKGGLVVWTQQDPWPNAGGHLGEALADLILGKVDAFEIHARHRLSQTEVYYALLDCGLQVPLVGGSGKTGRRPALGSPRTYARLEPQTSFDYHSWIRAVRAGRTFVTYEPLLSFTVEGQDPGATVELSSPKQKIHLRAEAPGCCSPFQLEIVVNGKVVAWASPHGRTTPPVAQADLALPTGGWIAARCLQWSQTAGKHTPCFVTAHTSPVYVRVAGQPPGVDPQAIALLQRSLDETLTWVDRRGRFENDKQKQNLVEILLKAKEKLGMVPSS
jgi:hypothetical protein